MLDNVTINQLRAFVAVCDQGSFSGAARQLRRAQSAISHAIKALESAFDVELFERNTRKATLTAAGRSLLPDARAVISRTEEMKTRAVSIAEAGVRCEARSAQGKLVLGAHAASSGGGRPRERNTRRTPTARMAHAPPHLHDLAAARVLVLRMRDTAGRAAWQSSALPKGYQPAHRLTQRRKTPKARHP